MPARRKNQSPPPAAFPYGRRLDLPYLIGVYLGVNAVRDAWLVVDGPDCSHFKGQFIFGKHDWRSTLYRVDGRHRIVFTGTNAQNVTGKRDRLIGDTIRKAMVDEAGVVLLTSMPLCGITGAQYDRIIDGVERRVPVIEIPGLSLRGDWLEGFSETLLALARERRIPSVKPRRNAVAVVGHLMDRNEGDQVGNIAEFSRLLRALGLDPVAVWPDGGGWAGLDRVARAGTIVSLPYGRAAARTLAERTGARLLETGVPCGLDGTRRWVEEIGAFFGREARAKKVVGTELDRIIPRIERIVPFYFLSRGAAILADPHLLPHLAGLCEDLGMRVRFASATGREAHAAVGATSGVPIRSDLFEGGSLHSILRAEGLSPGDLMICNGEHARGLRSQFSILEIGVPSYSHHVFSDTPFLGFEGALHLVNRMANALLQPRDGQ